MYWSLPGTNLKKVPGSVPRWERMTDRISLGAMLLPMRYRCGGPAENIPASGHIRLIRWENATCAGLLECRIADRAGGKYKKKTDSKFICNVSLDFYVTFFSDVRKKGKKKSTDSKPSGLPSPGGFVRLRFTTARQPLMRSALYGRAVPHCPASGCCATLPASCDSAVTSRRGILRTLRFTPLIFASKKIYG